MRKGAANKGVGSGFRSAAAMILAIGALWPVESQARDRPGTPVNQMLFTCNGYDSARYAAIKPPKICVKFTNTANESVTFEVAVTANAQRMDDNWLHSHIGLYNTQGAAEGISQTVGRSYSAHRPHFIKRRNGEGRFWLEGFTLENLALNTVYCVFIKAKTEGNIVSGMWSQSPCLRTRS